MSTKKQGCSGDEMGVIGQDIGPKNDVTAIKENIAEEVDTEFNSMHGNIQEAVEDIFATNPAILLSEMECEPVPSIDKGRLEAIERYRMLIASNKSPREVEKARKRAFELGVPADVLDMCYQKAISTLASKNSAKNTTITSPINISITPDVFEFLKDTPIPFNVQTHPGSSIGVVAGAVLPIHTVEPVPPPTTALSTCKTKTGYQPSNCE